MYKAALGLSRGQGVQGKVGSKRWKVRGKSRWLYGFFLYLSG